MVRWKSAVRVSEAARFQDEKIMGLLSRLLAVRPPQLAADEHIVWQSRAGIVDRTAHAGNLYVTTHRVIYLDNKSNFLRRVNREWPLELIESIGIAKPDGTLYTGGVHRRLRMTTTEGDVLFNVMPRLDEKTAQLQHAIFGRAKDLSG